MAQRNFLVSTTAISLTASGTTIASGNIATSTDTLAQTMVRTGIGASELRSGSQTWTIHYVVSAMTTPYSMHLRLKRRNSSGVDQGSPSSFGTSRTATGTYDDNITWDSGTWSAGDQLVVEWWHSRPSGSGNKSGTITANGSSYVDAPAGSQTISPTGIASSEAFGGGKLNRNVTPSGIGTAEAIGSAKVNMNVRPTGLASAEAFGTAKLNRTIAKVGDIGMSGFDTFTDTDGKELSQHLPETGGPWFQPAYENTDKLNINANRVTKDSGTGAAMYLLTKAIGDDQIARATIRMNTSIAVNAALVLRADTTSPSNYYWARHNQSNGRWSIRSTVNAAAAVELGFWDETLIAGDEREIVFLVAGSKLMLFIQGVLRISVTNTDHTTGKAGIRFSGAASGTTGYAIDNFQAETYQFGSPTLQQIFRIQPTAIASAEALGAATLVRGSVTIATSGIASVETFGSTKLNRTIAPVGMATSEAFGASTLRQSQTLTLTGIASAQAFGAATVVRGNVTILTTGIASAEGFGTLKLSRSVNPSGIATAEALGGAVVQRGTFTISPTAIASTETFGAPSLQRGAVTISPSGILSAEAFGAASVVSVTHLLPLAIASAEAFGTSRLARTVSPAGIVSSAAFGSHVITAGAVTIAPPGIASAAIFGSVLVQAGPVTLAPAAIATAEAFGTPAIARTLITVSIVGAEAFGAPQLARTIHAGALASSEEFGSSNVQGGGARITPAGIPSTEAFGAVTVQRGSVTVTVPSITSAEAFGPVLVQARNTLAPSSIAPSETFGTLQLNRTITIAGIASGESLGDVLLNAGALILSPVAIASAEVVTAPALQPGSVTVLPTGIASSETIGTPTLSRGPVNILPTGISSQTAFGAPSLSPGGIRILPAGIPSSETVAAPLVSAGQTILPPSINSLEAVGVATVSSAALHILVSGIASAEVCGALLVQQQIVIFLPPAHANNSTMRTVTAGNSFSGVALETKFDGVTFLSDFPDL